MQHHHFDGYFLYYFKCLDCGKIWRMSPYIQLIPYDGRDGSPEPDGCYYELKEDEDE